MTPAGFTASGDGVGRAAAVTGTSFVELKLRPADAARHDSSLGRRIHPGDAFRWEISGARAARGEQAQPEVCRGGRSVWTATFFCKPTRLKMSQSDALASAQAHRIIEARVRQVECQT